MKLRSRQQGFTIIELMIATAVFAFIMLIATTGIIKIGQLYYKGVTVTKTQDTARAVSEEISRAIQFSDGTVTKISGASINVYCVGDTRYRAANDLVYTDTSGPGLGTGLVAEKLQTGTACNSGSPAPIETRQLLGKQMRLLNFDIAKLPLSDDAWSVNIKLGYGHNDLLSHWSANGAARVGGDSERISANCKSGIAGTSFCAVAKLDTVVKKRLN